MERRYRDPIKERWIQIIGYAVLMGIVLGIFIHLWSAPLVVIREAEAATTTPEVVEKVVMIEVEYSKEGIERLIRETFPEAPNTAVAVAKCESDLNKDIQSHHILSYGREQSFGIFQIHARDWDARAKNLGFENYRTDVEDNVKMARYLYKSRGNFKDWTCYNSGAYKNFL